MDSRKAGISNMQDSFDPSCKVVLVPDSHMTETGYPLSIGYPWCCSESIPVLVNDVSSLLDCLLRSGGGLDWGTHTQQQSSVTTAERISSSVMQISWPTDSETASQHDIRAYDQRPSHRNTGHHLKATARLGEYEEENLRSAACCRLENAIFSPLIHQTWP